VLECLSFYLIISYNKSQKEIWANSSNMFVGRVNAYMQGAEDFFSLQNVNDSLLIENAQLLETIINYRINSLDNNFQEFEDVDTTKNYTLIPSRICSKTINLRNNFMTLCKGSDNGIDVGMGVITQNGIAGIISQVSSDFSTVLLLLNNESRTSAKISGKNYFGNLLWRNGNPQLMNLLDVPKHAKISIGDTVMTSGYSISYPEGIIIGTIKDYRPQEGSNSYNIEVELTSDISAIDYAYVVSYNNAEEKQELLESNE
jgi:rod shape-determining protein MreC